jgi:hypothetical protein
VPEVKLDLRRESLRPRLLDPQEDSPEPSGRRRDRLGLPVERAERRRRFRPLGDGLLDPPLVPFDDEFEQAVQFIGRLHLFGTPEPRTRQGENVSESPESD